MEFLTKINDPVLLALASTCFTWFMTALGAGMVFFFKEINKRVLNMMLGFAAGIMVAASFWSLLEPAIEMAQSAPIPAWLVAAIGFVGGAGFLCLADHVMPHAHFFAKEGQTEGIPTHLKRSIVQHNAAQYPGRPCRRRGLWRSGGKRRPYILACGYGSGAWHRPAKLSGRRGGIHSAEARRYEPL